MNVRERTRLLESGDSQGRTGFHVTGAVAAKDILRDGFWAGHGDLGYGVYFWKSLERARRYAAKDGWDGLLKDPVIIEVRDSALQDIDPWDIHLDWNAADDEAMLWAPMDEDDQDDTGWRPADMRIVG